jgi:hypothetical protein
VAGSVVAFVEEFRAAGDGGAMRALGQTTPRSREFRRFPYLIFQPAEGSREPVHIGIDPADWTEHYIARGHVNAEPAIAMTAETIAPFAWRRDRAHRAASGTRQ